MELRSVHKSFPHSPLGGEKHQMLNLNHRLETYLGQVRLLEEENELLAREVRALRRNNHGASARREGLEEELWRARLEVEAAWGDRVHTELEAGRVAEELQALELQRQREAQAQVEANRKLEHSRKELEEEQRAQVWLREQVGQLEDQMRHLIRSHQEDVAHLEATLTQSRATMAPTLAQRGYQTPDLQQLGQEYSHRATRAWQEAAEAHQGHLDRLEESLTQTRSRLTQVGQEKSESQLKLRALEKELEAAQHIRMHLEKTAAQQGAGYSQEVQLLQEHLDGLEAEREELGQQVDHVLEVNQNLLQQKRSLGREVATYRALLDSERLGGRVPLFNQPRDITDAGSGPWGVKRSYQTRLSAGHKTTSRSPARGSTGRGPAAFTATPTRRRTPVPLADTPQGSSTPDTTQSAAWETPYPKILQGGAVENFRPQEVHEEVSYAEPLSPPNEQEAGTTSGGEGGEEDWNNVGEEPTKDGPVIQSVASHQAGLSTEPPLSQHQSTTAHLTPDSVRPTEEPPISQHQSTTAHLTPDSVRPTEEPPISQHQSTTAHLTPDSVRPTEEPPISQHQSTTAHLTPDSVSPTEEPPLSQHQSTTAHLTPDSVRPTEEPPLSQHQSTTAHLTPDSVSPTEEPPLSQHQSTTAHLTPDSVSPTEEPPLSQHQSTTAHLTPDSVRPTEEPPLSQHQSTTAHLTPDSVRPTEEPPLSQHQSTTAHLTPDSVRPTEEPRGFSHESHTDVPFERRVERELHAPVDAWAREREREFIERQRERVQEETSGFETEAVTSKPASEREAEESSLDRETDLSPEESTLKEHEAELRQEVSCPRGGTNQTDVEDKLYPDGEEMDTWDSVIERKVDLKTEEGIKKDEGQHAEPEEDISEQKHETRGRRSDSATGEHQDDDEASSVMDTQVDDDGRHAALDRERALSPGSEEDDDEEDSQNVSVSWRTELEGDSYAQDNTLADTRPLIRYESDETAGNAQAPHVDESDSSEGEPEQKVGETGMWSEGESKRFGTMEDLCEEVEGEALDEEYAHMENRDEGHGQTLREQATLGNAEGMIRKVSEGQSDVETEEGTKPTTPTNLCSDEELETDRLVEQELESLATESYSAHFAQQQGSGSEEAPNQEAAIESCTEPDLRGDQQLSSSTTITGQADEDLYLCDWSVVVPPADPLVDEEVQHKDQEEIEAPEEEHNASMVTEGPCSFTVFTSRPDGEDINTSEDPNSVLQVPAEQEDLQHVAAVTEEASGADHKEFPEAPETAQWEVLENPSEDFEFGDQSEDYEKCDNVPESAESYLHDDGGSDEVSPVSGPDEKDLFVGKDSAQVNTNGKDNSLHGFCSSGLTKEMWVSSMETGAAHQPGEAWNEAAQRANHSVLNVVHSSVDMDSSQAQNAEKEPEHSEVKQVKQVEQVKQVKQVEQVLRRNVAEGEFVCSDESDGDGESWSSGEEPV